VTGKKHVVHVGFFERTAELLDFDNYDVSVVLDPPTAKSLPKWLRERFAAIGVIDVPDRLNLEDYDQASDQMIGLVEEFSKTLGEPSGIVGLYEHTTVPAARLREHFGLPGTDLATSALFRDKVRMKEALRGVVPLPRFWSVDSSTSQADLREIVGELPGKVVLKPKSQAASFGVEIFDSAADLLTHAETTGISDGYEVEEFVEGTVCHFDGVLRDGRLCFLNVSRYVGDCFAFQHRNQPLASVTIDDPALVARASEFTDRVLTTMGLRDSTFHLEAFHTPDDTLVFLEVANRFGGAFISQHVKAVLGVDLVEESIAACLLLPSAVESGAADGADGPSELPVASGWVYPALREKSQCRVKRIHGLDKCPDSVVLSDIPSIGQVLNEHPDVFVAAGKFVLTGPSTAAVERDIQTVIETYSLDLDVLA
jgi:hypothetical protein